MSGYDEREMAIKHVQCPYCNAKAGRLCRTVKSVNRGVWTIGRGLPTAVHMARLNVIRDVYAAGFLAGERDAK